jgi:hypothetical protein
VRAALAVTGSLGSIGQDILDREQAEGWGTKVIGRLAKDLGTEFPGIEGLARATSNMRAFAEAWRGGI